MSGAAAARWDAFLAQIEERHAAVCEEAKRGAAEALVACNHDPAPIANAFGAVQHRLLELESRIIDTWEEKVDDAFEAEEASAEVTAAARAKGSRLRFDLENRRTTLETRIFADGARAIYARALELQRERLCPRCGAPLDVPPTHRAVNLTCQHCSALTTFEPGMLLRSAVAWGAHPIASETAYQEWLAMREAEREVGETRSPAPLALLKRWELAQIAYWHVYFTARAPFEPELSDVTRMVRSRMEPWYTMTAEHEENWRQAGRPREFR